MNKSQEEIEKLLNEARSIIDDIEVLVMKMPSLHWTKKPEILEEITTYYRRLLKLPVSPEFSTNMGGISANMLLACKELAASRPGYGLRSDEYLRDEALTQISRLRSVVEKSDKTNS